LHQREQIVGFARFGFEGGKILMIGGGGLSLHIFGGAHFGIGKLAPDGMTDLKPD